MPIYNGNYVAPVWVNDTAPAINDTELLAMSRTIQASQVLTGSTPPTQYTGGVTGQRYADMSTSPPTIWKLQTAADEANVWVSEDGAGNLAQEYAANTGYSEGNYCIHEGYLYRANTDITGEAWTAAHWTRAYAAEDLTAHEQDNQNPHGVTAAQTGAIPGTVIATVESSTTASKAYAVGDYLILGGVLYKVTAAITQGGTITVGTNVATAVLGDDVAGQKLKRGSITLSTTWTGAASPYSQTVTVTGVTVTSESQIELQPSPAQIADLISAGTLALQAENNNGTVTVYAIGTAPISSLTIQCTVTNAGEGGGGGGAGNAYVSADPPSSSVGQNGEYYFQLNNQDTYGITSGDLISTAYTPKAGWEFTALSAIEVVGLRVFSLKGVTDTIVLGTSSEQLVSKEVQTQANNWTSVMLDNPIQLTANTNYIVMALGSTSNSLAYTQASLLTLDSRISFVQARYGSYPGYTEAGNVYAADIIISNPTPPYPVKTQYYKTGGVWVAV